MDKFLQNGLKKLYEDGRLLEWKVPDDFDDSEGITGEVYLQQCC